MIKTILYSIERVLSIILSVSSCMGTFFIGYFVTGLFYDDLSNGAIIAIFLASIILTYINLYALTYVRYERLEILADELETEKNEREQGENSQELFEHLRVK